MLFHSLGLTETFQILKTDQESGLSEKEAEKRVIKHGKNVLPKDKPYSRLKTLAAQFRSPLIYILIIAGIISVFLRHFSDSIIIFAAVFLNAGLGFWQENKASEIMKQLKETIQPKTVVLRDGEIKEILSEDLTVGDIFFIKSGDKIPADGRIIESFNLKINESALTGEVLPVEKSPDDVFKEEAALGDRKNMAFMGTTVEEGRGKAIVTAVGEKAEYGSIAFELLTMEEEQTPLQRRIAKFGKNITILITFLVLLIFLIGLMRGMEFRELFIVSVSVAVSAIPEALPLTIGFVLALGMQRILRKNGLIRHLGSVETLGSTSVICTDKTGTLTLGHMQVSEILTGAGKLLDQKPEKEEDGRLFALKSAALASSVIIENETDEQGEPIIKGSHTEKALVYAAIGAGIGKESLEEEQEELGEIPFDSEKKYSAKLYRLKENKEHEMYFLGAPEKIVAMSDKILTEGKERKLTEKDRETLNKKLEAKISEGTRVLAVAFRKITKDETHNINQEKLHGFCEKLSFIGFIALRDPIRPEVYDLIKTAAKAKIKVVMITGDHKLTAASVAKELGFKITEENILTGEELDKMSDDELEKVIKKIKIFARVSPKHKLKIVTAFQSQGEITAMTGDGVNDALSLKRANIGIAVKSGTDVAKEASDLILLDNNFGTIVFAIREGRITFDNIRKVMIFLLKDAFSTVILVGGSMLVGLPLPILPGQILWINLIEDSFPAFALATEKGEENIMNEPPRNRQTSIFDPQMKSLIFSYAVVNNVFLFTLFVFLLNSGDAIEHIRSMMFVLLTINSLIYVFSLKNLRKTIFQTNLLSNKFLILAALGGLLMLILPLYFAPLQTLLKTVPLTFNDWLIILAFGLFNITLVEWMKHRYNKKVKK